MGKSPFTNNFEDEEFIYTTKSQIAALIDGDDDLCELLHVLVLFSPLDVELSDKENDLLKHFQHKITMMIHSHLIQQNDNLAALSKVTALVSMIKKFHQIGKILTYGMIKPVEYEDSIENITVQNMD